MFVRASPLTYSRGLASLTSIRQAEPSSRVLDAVLLVADLDLAAKLGVKPGSTVFSLQRVRYVMVRPSRSNIAL